MQKDFIGLLLASAGVAAQCDGRVNWLVRPQGEIEPAIVLYLISNAPRYTYKGEGSAKFSRVQCDLYAQTYTELDTLSKAFSSVVSGYRGVVGSTSFTGIFIDGWRESVDPGKTDAERLFRVSIDLMINHKEV